MPSDDEPKPTINKVRIRHSDRDMNNGLLMHETEVALEGTESTKDLLEMAKDYVGGDGDEVRARRSVRPAS